MDTHFEPPATGACPHVSVVLCTWNGAPWLPELLASLVAQDRRPDEVVVQDDASTDDTIGLLRAFASNAPFPVYIGVNDHRVGSTRNFERALMRSRSQIVALSDQDDIWYRHKLSHLTAVLDEDPILTLALSDADLIDEADRPMGRTLWETRHIARYLRSHEIVPGPMFARRALSTGCTLAVRRRAVEAALPFPSSLDDDRAPMRHDRWLSLVAAAVGTIRTVPEPLLAFRVHPRQQTGVLHRGALAARLFDATRSAVASGGRSASDEHRVRAVQVAEAATRADRLGDFEEADALRRVVQHHLFRSELGPTVYSRLWGIAEEVVTDGYDRSVLGLAGAAADVARSVRPEAPDRKGP